MNEGHTAGPQLVGQLTEDDPVGQSLSQVIGQGPEQIYKRVDKRLGKEAAEGSQEAQGPTWNPHESHLSYLAQLSHHLLFVQKLGGSPRS